MWYSPLKNFPLQSCDYLFKISIEINAVTEPRHKLDLTKALMHDFHYNCMQPKYGRKVKQGSLNKKET